MRTLAVVLVATFLLVPVAGCKSECERAAEKYCSKRKPADREYCEGFQELRCLKKS